MFERPPAPPPPPPLVPCADTAWPPGVVPCRDPDGALVWVPRDPGNADFARLVAAGLIEVPE